MATGKPDFFLIGAPKCGTSAMATYLSEHPKIFFCSPKEPFHWCTDYPELAREMGTVSISDYLRLFTGARSEHLAVGEGSTRYLTSDVAVPRILEFEPRARLVVMLRNPVDAVQSQHSEFRFRFEEDIADFREAWNLQSERAGGLHVPRNCLNPAFLQYGRMYSYSWQIERLFSWVRREQLLILLFDDLVNDARSQYQQVLQFLNVPDDGRVSFPKVREAQSHRFPLLSRWLMHPPPLLRSAVRWVKNRVRRSIAPRSRQLVSALKVKQPRVQIDVELERELRDYFSPDVARLSELLDRDLTHWTTGSTSAAAVTCDS